MARKKDEKKKATPISRTTATIRTPKPRAPKPPPVPLPVKVPQKTDSKDTVTVAEQIKVVEATKDAHTLDVIESADNRPGVRLAINIQREEIAKAAKAKEPVKEDKFPVEELVKIEKELAPVAAPVVEATPAPRNHIHEVPGPHPTPEAPKAELVVDEPAAPAPVVEKPAEKPEAVLADNQAPPVNSADDTVVVKPEPAVVAPDRPKFLSPDEAEELWIAERSGKLAAENVATKGARAAVDAAKGDVASLAKEQAGAAGRLRAAQAELEKATAREAGRHPVGPTAPPVEEPKTKVENVEDKPAPAEAKSETSGPPNALL